MIFRSSFAPFQSSLLPATFRSVSPALALASRSTAPVATPQLRGGWVDEGYQLSVDLPGVPESAVHVAVAGRTLSIDVDHNTDGHQQRWSERLRLPQTLDTEQVTAGYRDGRLTVTIGRAVEPEARTITIDTSAPLVELADSADVEPTATGEVVSTEAAEANPTADVS